MKVYSSGIMMTSTKGRVTSMRRPVQSALRCLRVRPLRWEEILVLLMSNARSSSQP